ncbi:MAG: serine hydrolase [Balneolales bacterium]
MRVLKFLGFFLAVAILLIGSIFYLNRDVFISVFENRASFAEGSEWVEKTYSLNGLVEYIEGHPEFVSVISYDIDHPENGIFFQEDVKRVLGTSSNLFLLIEYARQVSEGTLDPDQLVSFDKVKRYHLPAFENNRHKEAIRTLQDNNLITPDGLVKISDVVSVMVLHNDLASADFLYYFFGPEKINTLVKDLGEDRIEPLQPFSGLHITFNPGFHETTTEDRHERLMTNKAGLIQEISQNALAYQNNEEFRKRVLDYFQQEGTNISFTEERMMYDIFPSGEPVAFTEILEQIIRGTLFSKEASDMIREYLSWPMSSGSITRNFDYYGAMYDNRISILNGLDIGTSSYTKNDHVQVVFFEKLPIGFWMHMSSNFISQDYQKRLIYDPALYEVSKAKLTQ